MGGPGTTSSATACRASGRPRLSSATYCRPRCASSASAARRISGWSCGPSPAARATPRRVTALLPRRQARRARRLSAGLVRLRHRRGHAPGAGRDTTDVGPRHNLRIAGLERPAAGLSSEARDGGGAPGMDIDGDGQGDARVERAGEGAKRVLFGAAAAGVTGIGLLDQTLPAPPRCRPGDACRVPDRVIPALEALTTPHPPDLGARGRRGTRVAPRASWQDPRHRPGRLRMAIVARERPIPSGREPVGQVGGGLGIAGLRPPPGTDTERSRESAERARDAPQIPQPACGDGRPPMPCRCARASARTGITPRAPGCRVRAASCRR